MLEGNRYLIQRQVDPGLVDPMVSPMDLLWSIIKRHSGGRCIQHLPAHQKLSSGRVGVSVAVCRAGVPAAVCAGRILIPGGFYRK